MAFNKARALEEAAKLVNQKKISQAVKLYLAVSEQDPSDLNLLNTIGDLCLRENNSPEALRQFHRLASAYVREGFVLKAIAIYRKIAKLESNSVEPLLKLGELYTQQGLGREAKEQYSTALAFCKERSLYSWTIEILRKLLVQDAGNLVYRVQLGEAYQSQGSTREALHAFVDAAGLAFDHGDVKTAESALNKACEIDPHFPGIHLARASFALANRRPEDAVSVLRAEPALENQHEANQLLLQAYLELARHEEAERVAIELFRRHPQDFTPLGQLSLRLLETKGDDAALRPIVDAWDLALEYRHGQQIMHSLQAVLSRHPDHIPALEQCLRLEDALGGQESLPATLEALGEAYGKVRRFEDAEGVYRRLLNLQPENPTWQHRLDESLRQLGRLDEPGNPQAARAADPDAAAPEPAILPAGPDEPLGGALGEAIETSDLFVKFGLDDQAAESLEKALEQFPDEVELLARLVDTASRVDAAKAARMAVRTAARYEELDDAARAELYRKRALELNVQAEAAVHSVQPGEPEKDAKSDAIAKALNKASAGAGTAVASESAEGLEIAESTGAAISAGAAEPAPIDANGAGEIDLSEEWEQFLSGRAFEGVASPFEFSPELREQISEIDFYLQYGFINEARQLLEALMRSFPSHPELLALEHKVRGFNMVAHNGAESTPPREEADPGHSRNMQDDQLELRPQWMAGLPVEMDDEAALRLSGEAEAELVAPELEFLRPFETRQTETGDTRAGRIQHGDPVVNPEGLGAGMGETHGPVTGLAEPQNEELAAGAAKQAESPASVEAFAPEQYQDQESVPPDAVMELPAPAEAVEPLDQVAQATPEPSPDALFTEAVLLPHPEAAELSPSSELQGPLVDPSPEVDAVAAARSIADRIEMIDEPAAAPFSEAVFDLTAEQTFMREEESSFELVEEDFVWPGPELEFALPGETVGCAKVADASLLLPFSDERIEIGTVEFALGGEMPGEELQRSEATNLPWPPLEAVCDAEPGDLAVPEGLPPLTAGADFVPAPAPQPAILDATALIDGVEKPDEKEGSFPGGSASLCDLDPGIDLSADAEDASARSGSNPAPILQSQPADLNAELAGLLAELQPLPSASNFPENPVTHYNLGVAFREMGLLDEAIGEFQKIFKGLRKGTFPPCYLEACTLLAHCFREKGMLPIAARWFERALEMPDLDDDTMMALNYDLAEVYKDLGRPQAAMQKYLEVYSQNIDYRDVAERIQALQVKVF